jgi:hypothetical protein
LFKLKIDRRWGLTSATAWARLLVDRVQILVLCSTTKLSWRRKQANGTSTTAAMYATVTTTDIAPTAGDEGGEGK